MNHKSILVCLTSRLTLAAVFIVASACGYAPRFLPETELPLAEYAAKVVVTASHADIAEGRALAGNYLVAFREEIGRPRVSSFASFHSEYQFHYEALAERFLSDARVMDINYITDVDLHDLGADPAAEDFAAPHALQFAWRKKPRRPPAAVLSEVHFKDEASAQQILGEWEHGGKIWFAEPNYINELQDQISPKVRARLAKESANLTANAYSAAIEPYAALGQVGWWHAAIKLNDAFKKIAESTAELSTPVIAVLDSGADVNNPILKDRIWNNPSPGQSGCSGDVYGCDTTSASKGNIGSGSVYPYGTSDYGQPCPTANDATGQLVDKDAACAHGTHVAGIIAGDVASGTGAGGVCPVCKVMVIKIIKDVGGKGVALDSAILNGLKYLTRFKKSDNGSVVRVANTSFGKYNRSRSVSVVVSVLKHAPNQVLLIGAAGNEDSMLRVYPAALNDAIAVGATGLSNQKAGYSNFGPWVDIAAPGGDIHSSATVPPPGADVVSEVTVGSGNNQILSSVPGGTAQEKQGTSMASPVVAGVAGMILSIDPNRGWDNLRKSLLKTADAETLYKGGSYNQMYYFPKIKGDQVPRALLGSGLLDAAAALDGTADTGVNNTNLRRITRGCSVISLVSSRSLGKDNFWWIFLIPLVQVIFSSNFVFNRTPRRHKAKGVPI